jgi:threonine dehydrogenase-like Zn-dependent dehydrogenase
VIDAVGMEAHGNPLSEKVIGAASRLPKPVARAAIEHVGIDRLSALHTAIAAVRRGGTLSISGVYGGMADPMPMMDLFDKGLTVRMGQCHVRRWSDDLLDLVSGADDVLGLESLATHHAPLEAAPDLYRTFQEKNDGCLKVVLQP